MKTAVKGVPRAPRERPPGAWLRIGEGRLLLDIKALPGAPKTALAGVREGRLRVRLAAPPEDGRANAALIAFLAKILTCPKSKIVIYLGKKARLKTIAVTAESPETLESLAETLKLTIIEGEP